MLWTFSVALSADLLTKAFAVGRVAVIYNDKPGELLRRLVMSIQAYAGSFCVAPSNRGGQPWVPCGEIVKRKVRPGHSSILRLKWCPA